MASPNAGIAAWRFKLAAEIHSYADARDFLRAKSFSGQYADLGANMAVVVSESRFGAEIYAVRLYETEIIRYYPDGTFSVDNGGFNTPTTMYRLNAVLPEGWTANHHKKQLALRRNGGPWLEFWPCTHERRMTA